MDTFKAYILKKAYERIQKLGGKLAKIEPLIDWEASDPSSNPSTTTKDPEADDPTSTR